MSTKPTMRTVKVSEAAEAVLDWLVAKCEIHALSSDGISTLVTIGTRLMILGPTASGCGWSPSTDPTYAYPIIDQEGIATWKNDDEWRASLPQGGSGGYYSIDDGILDVSGHDGVGGPTVLVAAMRCYVSSKMGETAEVPSELAP